MKKSPDAFRTISEVAEALDTPAHVLRFWESRFTQIKPVKRAGGRRYYRPADMALLGGIKHLLHDEGMTIRGVQKVLREQGIRHVAGLAESPDGGADTAGETVPEAPFTEVEMEPEAQAPRDNVVPLAGARDQAPEPAPVSAAEPAPGAEAAPESSAAPEAEAPEVEAEPADAPAMTETPPEMPAPYTAEDAPLLPDPDFPGDALAEGETAHPAPLPDPDAPAAPGLPDMAQQGTQQAEAEEVAPELPQPELPQPELPLPESAPEETAPLYDLSALPDESTGVAEDEDLPPALATRIRALPPLAVPGPDGEELARLSDKLKALRHKVAGHARRAGR